MSDKYSLVWLYCVFFFYPRPVLAFGYCRWLRLSVCPSVRVCGNYLLVRAITHHPFKLGPPNSDQRCWIPWLGSLLFWGLIELDMSNLTNFRNPVYFRHFCVFEIFVRPAKKDETESVPHPKWLCTYMFAHRNVSWTVEHSGCIFSVTIAGFPVPDSAIGNGFLMLL